ncbi:MAG TPA: SGNH/GDSL hydrolase family protein, partial [Prolixibacteraceae bacterium]|nr:SGNH/GDSL hydrolase family protein [Prolixibacteraceae bacterium]
NARNIVNTWIRTSGKFDAVIDFDKIMRNPSDTITLMPDLHTGDFLHPNEAGYQRMGEAIDLTLFK